MSFQMQLLAPRLLEVYTDQAQSVKFFYEDLVDNSNKIISYIIFKKENIRKNVKRCIE
jgi:hypothetical protein